MYIMKRDGKYRLFGGGLLCGEFDTRRKAETYAAEALWSRPIDKYTFYVMVDGERVDITPCTDHDPRIHHQLGTQSDSELNSYIDNSCDRDWYDDDLNYLGPDVNGLEVEVKWSDELIDDDDRDFLVECIEAADLECPEQVADLVIDAAKRGGLPAGIKELHRCIDDE